MMELYRSTCYTHFLIDRMLNILVANIHNVDHAIQ
jgi:hypothetical protein